MLWLTVIHDQRAYRYVLQQLKPQGEREVWKVIARNGHLILSNNRPVLARHMLKHRTPDWKVEYGGNVNSRNFMEKLIEAVEQCIRRNMNQKST